MKSSTNNKILPVKFIVQNLREESHQHHPSHKHAHNNSQLHHKHHQIANNKNQHLQDLYNNPLSHRQSTKVISLGKNMSKKSCLNTPRQIKEQIFNNNPELKNKRSDFFQGFQQNNALNIQFDPHINNFMTPKTSRQQKQYIEPTVDINKGSRHKLLGYLESLENTSLNLTDKFNSKFQEETRYGSRGENFINYSMEIDKEELKKIKAQLNQKQAIIYEKTQFILQKQSQILEITRKLDLASQLNKNLRAKIQQLSSNKQGQSQCQESKSRWGQLQKAVYQKSREIECLRKQMCDQKLQSIQRQQQNNNSFKLINLKLRQYEFQERQLISCISELKDKEKKEIEHKQRTINAANQLLHQKEQQVNQLLSTADSLRKQNEKLQVLVNQNLPLLIQPSDIIRELSAEISDLKQNLRNMEMRIREMIQSEDEMKKSLQDEKYEVKILQSQRQQLQSVNKQMHCTIIDLENIIRKKQLNEDKLKRTVAELQDMGKKRNSLTHYIYKESLNSPIASSKSSGSSSKRSSSLCNGSCVESVNSRRSGSCGGVKLAKENERLSALVKECDRRLHQSYKLNGEINQQVVRRDLQLANNRLIRKCATQFSE